MSDLLNIAGLESLWIALAAFAAWLWGKAMYYRAKKEYKDFDMRDMVTTKLITIEQDRDAGVWYLKPRGGMRTLSLLDVVPNTVLADQVVIATKNGQNDDVKGQFVVLKENEDHKRFMHIVREYVSALDPEGHIARMCGRPVDLNECYFCVTYSRDGEDNKIKIQVIDAKMFQRFKDPEFVAGLHFLPEEGSHQDVVEAWQFCAERQFGGSTSPLAGFPYVLRVQIPTRAHT